MTPQAPVAPLSELMRHLPCGTFKEVTYAKDQPPYLPLPVVKLLDDGGMVISRWRLTWIERLRVLFTGDVFLSQLTFNEPLQPVKLTATFGEGFDQPRGEAYEPWGQ
jgi:hypothetical protein